MLDESLFQQVVLAVSDAIRRQDWDRLIVANRRLTEVVQSVILSDAQRQQLSDCYQTGLAQCQREADALWQKIQQTLQDREAMAAYACFGDAESFLG